MEHINCVHIFKTERKGQWEAVAKCVDTATGVRVVDTSKAVRLPGRRTYEVLKGNDIPANTSASFGFTSGYMEPGNPSLQISSQGKDGELAVALQAPVVWALEQECRRHLDQRTFRGQEYIVVGPPGRGDLAALQPKHPSAS